MPRFVKLPVFKSFTAQSTLPYERYLSRSYFGELDGVRALAVLFVVACHVKWNAFHFLGGHYGVNLFFVLSGYLITTLCLREEMATGRVSLASFYLRRTFRIFPLYYLVLSVYLLLLFVFHIHAEWEEYMREYWLGYLIYYQEFVKEWTDGRMPFVQSWTLGIEEKFYLVWPFVCCVLLNRTAVRVRWIVAVIGIMAFTLARPLLSLVGYSALGRCLEPYASILCGCTLALVLHNPTGYSIIAKVCRPGIGLAITTLAMIVVQGGVASAERSGFGRVWTLLYAITATAWLGVLILQDGPVQRVLRSGPLMLIGRLSYGIYLVHILALAPVHKLAERIADPMLRGGVALALGIALSSFIAYLLAVTVERPMIRIGRKLSGKIQRKGGVNLAKIA